MMLVHKCFILALSILLLLGSKANAEAACFPDFDKSLMRGDKSKTKYFNRFGLNPNPAIKTKHYERLGLLRSNYNRIVAIIKQNNRESSVVRIPRIIHQIWLGSEVPSKYIEWMSTWMHWIGWEYKLWTDTEVAQLKLINQDCYDEATNYGAKSDILRMELLYSMGGIYVDTDFECLKPDFFELLHKNVDFYIGIEPLEQSLLRINNAIIGSVPGHPLLLEYIKQLPVHFQAKKHRWPLISTGPVFISTLIYEYLQQEHDQLDLILPCSLVYPFNSGEIDFCDNPDKLVPMEETAAVHYWSKSWFKAR